MPAFASWRHAAALLVLLVLLLAGNTAQAQDPPRATPPLPTIAPETYPADAQEAIGAAYRAAAARPDAPDVVGELGLLLHAWEQFGAAASVYARAQDLAQRDVTWWYLGGLADTRRALPTAAARQFEVARTLMPESPLIALRLADARLAEGATAEAERLYRLLVTIPDSAPAAWYGLARIHLAARRTDEARQALSEALTLYPDFGAAHYALAQLQHRAGARDEATLSLARQRRCLSCWPMPEDPWRQRLDAIRQDAAALLARGVSSASARTAAADAEAIRLHEAALEQDPTRGQAHVNLIELYGRTGNVPAAERHFHLAVGLPGLAAEAHRAYGMLLLSHQKAPDAIGHFEQAVATVPHDAVALQGLGLAHEVLSQPERAVTSYQRALEALPTLRGARFGLARVLLRQQQFDAAIGQLEHLRLPEDAETARYVFALAVAHVRKGDIPAGKRAAGEALALARRYDQQDLAASIETELRKLEPAP